MSLFGIDFLRNVNRYLSVDDLDVAIDLVERGYLFLATAAGAKILRRNYQLQTEVGADIEYLQGKQLSQRYPWLNVSDLEAGCIGRSGEGWFDGYGLMMAFRRKARSLKVNYMKGGVDKVVTHRGVVSGARLEDGTEISCGHVVNACGVDGARLAATVGIKIDVRPKKRMVFTFRCKERLKDFPLLIDPSGLYVRPEGDMYITGMSPTEDCDPDSRDFRVDYDIFEQTLWPLLASRVTAFEAIKQGRAWAGHYDVNMFDHNAIVGEVSSPRGFYLANGFSGHGLQQAPAVGRGIAELIAHGEYRSLDLSPLSYARIVNETPLVEASVI